MVERGADRAGRRDRAPAGRAGWCDWLFLVPGVPQWGRGERSRGLVLLGSFGSALLVGVFCWGSALGAALLGVAFAMHAASVADAVRRSAFPGFGPWAPWFSAVVGLAAACYGPGLVVAWQLAYPARAGEGGFLVNRSAYAQQGPEPGQFVWLEGDRPRGGPPAVARVVARAGQVVSWSPSGLVVDGRRSWVDLQGPAPGLRSRVRFEVPERSILVFCEGSGAQGPKDSESPLPAAGLSIVSIDRVTGRPWACSYPIWSRQWLG